MKIPPISLLVKYDKFSTELLSKALTLSKDKDGIIALPEPVRNGHTLLETAVKAQNLEKLTLHLQRGLGPRQAAMKLACKEGSIETIRILQEFGVPPEC